MSDPQVETRTERPYMGIHAVARMEELPTVIPQLIGEVFSWLGQHGMQPNGAPLIRYNVINMESELDIDIGVPVASASASGNSRVSAKMLPAGRYATLLHVGPYDKLMAANAALIDWAKAQGLQWDRWDDPKGDAFAARYESYLSEPGEKPERTEVAIKLAE